MFRKIQLHLLAAKLIRETNDAGLQKLRVMDMFIASLTSVFGRTSKSIQDLEQAFVRKVLILVTGIEDVIHTLDYIKTPSLRYQIIDKYSERTRFVSDIIKLLPYLRKNTSLIDLYALDLYGLEELLIKRAQKLVAADKQQSISDAGIELICMMAELVEDPFKDGAGSQSAENILITMALPKIKHNFKAAIKIAESFHLKSSTHRFMIAFVNANGIANSRMAKEIANTIRSCYFYGDELARKIIQFSNKSGLELGWELEERLEQISQQKLDDVELFHTFDLQDLLSGMKFETHNNPTYFSREDGIFIRNMPGKDSTSFFGEFPMQILSATMCSSPMKAEQIQGMSMISIGRIHDCLPMSKTMFREIFPDPPQGIHPDMLIMDVRCDVGIRKIGGQDKTEAIQSIEEVLREYAANGELDKITIHHMSVSDFVEKYGDELSPEVTGIVKYWFTL